MALGSESLRNRFYWLRCAWLNIDFGMVWQSYSDASQNAEHFSEHERHPVLNADASLTEQKTSKTSMLLHVIFPHSFLALFAGGANSASMRS
jgi:hypothetical protein